MNKSLEKLILRATNSRELYEIEEVQELWEGYGKIMRYGLVGSDIKSVVVKNVCLPKQAQKLRSGNISYFFFSSDGNSIAAVGFQYVGGGCGMKDIAYFVDSCLYDDECESWEADVLAFYFKELKEALNLKQKDIDFDALEGEWRELYPVA